ncbi:hypothetical protein [Paenibacillus glucanolyticus]|uniref:hypothetical protein n=1 Tax=Paenibacillus glucanolyticus TaxID=59843 RepID=UPI00096D33C0|nr:hypothetical protein [Paenibacillus glucanolyticus]OMF76664.1 hypothetical protein BK142_14160 [Paenibacillus glucanolyticus]
MIKYMNVEQVANEFGITPASVYKLMNHNDPNKRLEPVNRETYRGDGGYVFRVEDVERIKPLYIKNDLTSAQAAKQIGRSTSYIHKLIQDGVIDYYEGEYRGKKTYFLKQEDLDKLSEVKAADERNETLFDPKTGAFLFQLYMKGNQLARVVHIKKFSRTRIEISLQLDNGKVLPYNEAISDGWEPVIQLNSKKAITSYGYSVFEFPLPATMDSIIYSIIEELMKQAGPANLRINRSNEVIRVEVKKVVLKGILAATHPDMIDRMKLFLKRGKIIPKYDGLLIDTGLSPITLYISEDRKEKLIERLTNNKVTLQEWADEINNLDQTQFDQLLHSLGRLFSSAPAVRENE